MNLTFRPRRSQLVPLVRFQLAVSDFAKRGDCLWAIHLKRNGLQKSLIAHKSSEYEVNIQHETGTCDVCFIFS